MAARLLLIEDDAAIARFVALALEELPGHAAAAPAVELTVVPSLHAAREALRGGGWQLVVSDLMLPDGSAQALLAEGFAQAADAPPWVVFSAGVPDEQRPVLAAQGVVRVLRKPVPLVELLDTVAGLLAGGGPAARSTHGTDLAPDPVQAHFGGDRALYESFREGCLLRFADDLARGDAAVVAGDSASLRRVAHGLKAVLLLIGEPALSRGAGALEDETAREEAVLPTAAATAWRDLARGLVGLGVRRH